MNNTPPFTEPLILQRGYKVEWISTVSNRRGARNVPEGSIFIGFSDDLPVFLVPNLDD